MIRSQTFNLIQDKINDYMPKAYEFILEHPEEWELDHNVDLEVTNHVLRVRIQDNTIENSKKHVIDVSAAQNADGGWGNKRDDKESQPRATAFCVQMLLRANRVLKDETLQKSIMNGLNYIISHQKEDGSWEDSTWHFLDATSTSVGTLLFAVNEDFTNEKYKKALEKGMAFVVSQRHENGLWYYKLSGSPVTITAHLLQKCATYFEYTDIHDQSIRELIKLQHIDGHWDNGNTDHTCDAIRAMMLTASRSKDPSIISDVFHSACLAVQWLVQVSQGVGGGLGDRPGKPAHVERTCDGIDSMLKLKQFAEDNSQMIKYWR